MGTVPVWVNLLNPERATDQRHRARLCANDRFSREASRFASQPAAVALDGTLRFESPPGRLWCADVAPRGLHIQFAATHTLFLEGGDALGARSLMRSCQDLTKSSDSAIHRVMAHSSDCRLARMSSGRYCPIRDLGAVRGGKGLKHHEVVVDFTRRGLFRFVLKYPQRCRPGRTEQSSREASSWRHNCSQDATDVA